MTGSSCHASSKTHVPEPEKCYCHWDQLGELLGPCASAFASSLLSVIVQCSRCCKELPELLLDKLPKASQGAGAKRSEISLVKRREMWNVGPAGLCIAWTTRRRPC